MYALTEVVWKWCPYLLGHHFIFQTDHQSLRSLLHQTIQTFEQHKWLSKQLGYNFDIIYKPTSQNAPADALSCCPTPTYPSLSATSQPIATIWDALHQLYQSTSTTDTLFKSVQSSLTDHPNYTIRDGLLFYKNRVFILPDSTLAPILLSKFHNSPASRHARLTSTFW